MPETVLTVASLTCRLCAREISAALRDVPGVRTVAVDLRTSTVAVRGDTTSDRLQAALAAAGHTATEVSEGLQDHPSVGHDRAPHPDQWVPQGPRETTMNEYEIQVPGITCGHCVSAISASVGQLAGVATVHVDVATKRVRVVGDVPLEAVRDAIDEAGYEVVTS